MNFPRHICPLWGMVLLGFCLAWGGYAGISPPRMVEELERDVMDIYSQALRPPRGDWPVVLVLAREASFRKLGAWPWSRKIHGSMVNLLGNARTIVLDLIFPESRGSEEDRFLAEAVKRHGNCVVGAHLVREGEEEVLVLPYPELAASARHLGITNVVPDMDGLYRFLLPLWGYGKRSLPSISLAAALADSGSSLEMRHDPRGATLLLGGRPLPLEPFGGIWVTPWDYEKYPMYEYVDVLEGKITWSAFEDALVLVGVDVAGAMVQDMVPVPWKTGARTIPGVAFVALGTESLLSGTPPRSLSRKEILFWTLLFGFLGALGGLLGNPRWSWILFGTLGMAILGVSWFLWSSSGLWLPPVVPLLTLLLTYFGALFVRLLGLYRSVRLGSFYSEILASLTEQEKKDWHSPGAYLQQIWPRIQETTSIALLKRHASPKSVEQLLARGAQLLAREEGTWLLKISSTPHPYRLFIQPPSGWGGLVELGWRRRVSREDLQSAVAVVLSVSWFGVALKREAQRLRAFEGTIKAVVAAVDAKDAETRGHSDRVALLSRALAEALGLDPQFVEELYFGALLHDVGKIGIPDAILQKPDKLCYEEFEAIKEHPLLGKGIMEAVALPEVAVQGIVEHHERLDGTGYPRGLKGEEVSLAGRIIAVADAFDALSSRRTYKERWSLERIFAYFREERGTRYDPQVVDVLLSIGEDWYASRELPEAVLESEPAGESEEHERNHENHKEERNEKNEEDQQNERK